MGGRGFLPYPAAAAARGAYHMVTASVYQNPNPQETNGFSINKSNGFLLPCMPGLDPGLHHTRIRDESRCCSPLADFFLALFMEDMKKC